MTNNAGPRQLHRWLTARPPVILADIMAGRTDNPNLQRLLDGGIVAVLRLPSADLLPDVARALIAGGVLSIEVTMTTPNAIEGISKLSREFGSDAVIGVGTVLDAQTCRNAIEAGAEYVVSPAFDDAVHQAAKGNGKLSLPGAMTPTEILRAWSAGADIVKVFPSTALGPGYFRDVLAPLPHVRLMPTGGVDVKNVGDWIRAGAVCVGAGSNLVPKEAVAKKDWQAITANAKAFVEALRAARK
ncbi:MAG TPA: bifunctional 4-hydroxy-2-oxoglutarate aldolase/2-dehydro-3-deoxy-phosphogluconate aldolase [Tepidisphaeraceae bacterium]|nr:bifunctional 4-hydroxy-2-oxoglutarate aldolase/2-dehydro-3-deoxy-phosphogluconate aldolase [Tepidisphaeraceae bacterium]